MKINLVNIILTLLLLTSIINAQYSNEIKKINNLVAEADSILNSDSVRLRMFVKKTGSEIPKELLEFENWDENTLEIYNILFDENENPILFIVSPYSRSGDWSLSHTYYFNHKGETYFYQYYLAFFNSGCTRILRKYINIYFNDDFEVIDKIERYEDKDYKLISGISNCNILYDFKLDYSENKNFDVLIEKYRIEL